MNRPATALAYALKETLADWDRQDRELEDAIDGLGAEDVGPIDYRAIAERREKRLLEQVLKSEPVQAYVRELREAAEACQVFVTPLERRKGWNEYKEDAAQRLRALLGGLSAHEQTP